MLSRKDDPRYAAWGSVGGLRSAALTDTSARLRQATEAWHRKLRAEVRERFPAATDAEVERRVGLLLRAHYARMTAASVAGRRARRLAALRAELAALERELGQEDELDGEFPADPALASPATGDPKGGR